VHRPAGKLETYASEGWWIGLDDTSNGHRIYWTDRRTITVERSIRSSMRPMRVNKGEQDHLDIGPEDSSDVRRTQHRSRRGRSHDTTASTSYDICSGADVQVHVRKEAVTKDP
jgi:hypothetical protein